MRELNVQLIMCFALLFAATSGAGCASQTPSAGCSGQCATSISQGPTNPAVNNDAELNGNYAFTFSGITGNGSVSSVIATVGRFTADGAGNLTNGELETNGVGSMLWEERERSARGPWKKRTPPLTARPE